MNLQEDQKHKEKEEKKEIKTMKLTTAMIISTYGLMCFVTCVIRKNKALCPVLLCRTQGLLSEF